MIFVATTTFDDAAVLPAFFAHLRDHIDAFVVLDLGSRDDTLDVVRAEPKATALLRSTGVPAEGVRRALVERARQLGVTWFVWLDPDERLEPAFVDGLRAELATAERDRRSVLGVWARTLDETGQVLAHGPYALDHKYIVFHPDGLFGAAPPRTRRLTGFSASRLHSATASAPWRRLGLHARFRADPDVIDLQARPPRAIDEANPTDRWVERVFAACVCDDWDPLARLWATRPPVVDSDLGEDRDPIAAVRAWWKRGSRWLSYTANEDGALVLYRGSHRDVTAIATCRLTVAGDAVVAVSLSSAPLGRTLFDQLAANTERLETCERRPATHPGILTSVIMPFYKRLADFERVLPMNAPYLERPEVEVVLSLDEPTEEHGVLALIRRFPNIRWTVLVNDHDHAWRTPSRAINVGVRHAVGTYVLVVSPESAFVTDVPSIAHDLHACGGGFAAVGRVVFATYDELAASGSLADCYAAAPPAVWGAHASFRGGQPYGSLCVERDRLARIGGYDEALVLWGGDDDNMRVRLMLDGTIVGISDAMRLVHLAGGPRPPKPVRHALRDLERIYQPATALANPTEWGMTYNRIVQSWRSA
ncbi:MAG TPA: galactosyltransferase-related protein [Kofleriaceae bacterium]